MSTTDEPGQQARRPRALQHGTSAARRSDAERCTPAWQTWPANAAPAARSSAALQRTDKAGIQ